MWAGQHLSLTGWLEFCKCCLSVRSQRKLPADKRRKLEAQQDTEDFARDARLLKKLKRGILSEARGPAHSRDFCAYEQALLGILCTATRIPAP